MCGIPDVSNLTASAVTDATDSASGVTNSVPSLQKIQDTLVHIGDKPSTFLNSKTWIGAAEVAMCIDQLYQVSTGVRSGFIRWAGSLKVTKHGVGLWDGISLSLYLGLPSTPRSYGGNTTF